MNDRMKKKKIALSIFFTAFAFGLNITGIAPILGILNTMYVEKGTGGVQILQTLPYALLMTGSLMTGWLTTKFSKKRLVTFGLILIGICGILPFFKEGYYVLLVSRFLIGFGFGIVSPLNTAIVAEFFAPEERAGYLGLHVVGMGVGTMAGNFAGGILVNFGYRYFYLVYLIAFLAMVGVWLMLPDTGAAHTAKGQNMKLNKTVYLVSGASFVHTLFITVYSTNIAIYIMEAMTESASAAGIVTAVNAAFALMTGALFAKISKQLQTFTLPISIFAAVLGYIAILFIPGMAGVYIGSACCGASLSCFMAQCSYMISVSVEPEAVAKASGVFSVIGGIGGLISPILLGAAAGNIYGSNTSGNQFVVSSIGMAVLAAAALAAALGNRRRERDGCYNH